MAAASSPRLLRDRHPSAGDERETRLPLHGCMGPGSAAGRLSLDASPSYALVVRQPEPTRRGQFIRRRRLEPPTRPDRPYGTVYKNRHREHVPSRPRWGSNKPRQAALQPNSLLALDGGTGKLRSGLSRRSNDFHDWDLQLSPVLRTSGTARSSSSRREGCSSTPSRPRVAARLEAEVGRAQRPRPGNLLALQHKSS